MGIQSSINAILDKVPYTPLSQLAPDIHLIIASSNKKEIEVLAKKIYDRAVRNQDLCAKYLELVKLVSPVIPNDDFSPFKDVFLKCCIDNFENDCFAVAYEHKRYEAAFFFGQLFNTDLATSYLINHWIKLLNNKRDVQSVLLNTIEDKVRSEYRKPSHDENITVLRSFLIEPRIEHQTIRRQDYEASSSESSDFLNSNFDHHIEETYSQSGSEEEAGSKSMSEAFKEFLAKVDEVPKPNFDLGRFTTSNDEERKSCATVMLEQALLKPSKIKSYADVVREILCSFSISSKYQKTFGNHLGDICETEIEKLFNQASTLEWIKINNLGVFLSELYTREGLKKQLMNQWLENVQNRVARNDKNAIKVQLTCFKIMLPKMKLRDVQNHKFYLQQIKAHRDQGRIPSEFMQWTRETIGVDLVQLTGTTPASTSTSSLNNKPALDAIKISSSQICADFQNFLNDLRDGKQMKVGLKQLNSCSDSALKACALILLEHASLYPEEAKLYAAATTNAIISQMTSPSRKILFADFLAQYFEVELSKCFKPEKCYWERIKKVGAFLSELYNFEVIEMKLLNKWILSIIGSSVPESESALEALLLVTVKVSLKMKAREPIRHKQVMEHIECFSKTVEGSQKTADLKELLKQSSNDSNNQVFDDLQRVVNRMNFGNHNQILLEIIALRIANNDANCRNIANMLVSRAIQRVDLVPCICEVLSGLPMTLIPPIDRKTFMPQVVKSLMSQFEKLIGKDVGIVQSDQFINFTKELHSRSVIDNNAINEIVEHLAIGARSCSAAPFQLLLNFTRVFRDVLLKTSTEMMKNTEKTLRSHPQSTSQRFRADIEETLKILFPNQNGDGSSERRVTAIPVSQPTSGTIINPSKQTVTQGKFSTFFTDLVLQDIEAMKSSIGKLVIGAPAEMKDFALTFYDIFMTVKDQIAFAKLAQMVQDEICSRDFNCGASFKESLTEIVQEKFYELLQFDRIRQDKDLEKRAKCLIKLIGTLFKLGWIDSEQLERISDALAEDSFETFHQLKMFHKLLQVISITLVKNGDNNMCKNFHQILQTRVTSTKGTRSFLLCLEVIELLENIIELCNVQSPNIKSQVSRILSKMKPENVKRIADEIKSLQMRNLADLNGLIEAMLDKVLKGPEEASLCVQLSLEIKEVFVESADESKVSFVEILIEKCQEMLLNNLNGTIRLDQLQHTMTLLHFIAELYNVKIFNYDFINLCFELISDDGCDNAVDCMSFLIQKVGAKADAENNHELSSYFNKFEEIVLTENSFRSFVYDALIELRKNNWNRSTKPTETAQASSEIENMLNNLADDNILRVKDRLKQMIGEPGRGGMKELTTHLWKFASTKSHMAKIYAKLCNEIATAGDLSEIIAGTSRDCTRVTTSFQHCLIEFLQSRIIPLGCIAKQEMTEEFNDRLANVLMFIGELYRLDLISDELLEVFLKPTNKLSLNSLNKLISIVAPKASRSNNVRLLAFMMKLDDKAEELAGEFWIELRKDLTEITEIVSGLHKSEHEPIEQLL